MRWLFVLLLTGCGHLVSSLPSGILAFVPEVRPTVAYRHVSAHTASSIGDFRSLVVEIEIEVMSAMPHVAPTVMVEASCDGRVDSEWAFFLSLSNAESGDRKRDHVELFRVGWLDREPSSCELALALDDGDTEPHPYCYESGVTRPGPCTPGRDSAVSFLDAVPYARVAPVR